MLTGCMHSSMVHMTPSTTHDAQIHSFSVLDSLLAQQMPRDSMSLTVMGLLYGRASGSTVSPPMATGFPSTVSLIVYHSSNVLPFPNVTVPAVNGSLASKVICNGMERHHHILPTADAPADDCAVCICSWVGSLPCVGRPCVGSTPAESPAKCTSYQHLLGRLGVPCATVNPECAGHAPHCLPVWPPAGVGVCRQRLLCPSEVPTGNVIYESPHMHNQHTSLWRLQPPNHRGVRNMCLTLNVDKLIKQAPCYQAAKLLQRQFARWPPGQSKSSPQRPWRMRRPS